jgi:hypothetical protein
MLFSPRCRAAPRAGYRPAGNVTPASEAESLVKSDPVSGETLWQGQAASPAQVSAACEAARFSGFTGNGFRQLSFVGLQLRGKFFYRRLTLGKRPLCPNRKTALGSAD